MWQVYKEGVTNQGRSSVVLKTCTMKVATGGFGVNSGSLVDDDGRVNIHWQEHSY